MTPTTYSDAVEAVRAWVNGLAALVDPSGPLPGGAHRWDEQGPGEGAFAVLVYAGGGLAAGDAVFQQTARVSATVYAGSDAAARVGALAYANALEAFQYTPPATVTLATDGSQVIVQAVDNVTGPTQLAATGDYAYLVDAVFYLTPTP